MQKLWYVPTHTILKDYSSAPEKPLFGDCPTGYDTRIWLYLTFRIQQLARKHTNSLKLLYLQPLSMFFSQTLREGSEQSRVRRSVWIKILMKVGHMCCEVWFQKSSTTLHMKLPCQWMTKWPLNRKELITRDLIINRVEKLILNLYDTAGNHSASRRGFLRLSRVLPTSRVFTSGYVNTETILHFFN